MKRKKKGGKKKHDAKGIVESMKHYSFFAKAMGDTKAMRNGRQNLQKSRPCMRSRRRIS